MYFKNKVVLITGAGSGIGAATAKLFAKEEADIIIVDIHEEKANTTAEECKQIGNKVLVIVADVSKDNDAKRIINTTIDNFQKIDVLINNAGIAKEGTLLQGNIMETYDQIMNVNLRSVILMTSLATPYLIESKGCIVNTSSVASQGVKTAPTFPIYAISKSGVDQFTRTSALELASSGVRVNAVNPGCVKTDLLKNNGISHQWDEFISMTALKKIADPEEVADLIVYLASDKAKSITGTCHLMDNGMLLI